MSIFIGSSAGEIITPDFVSGSVLVVGNPKHPSGAADLIIAGAGADVVAGGGGDDLAFLGAGDDLFIWNPGDGSDFVGGGRGNDTLAFNGSSAAERIDVSADGGLGHVTRDVGSISMILDSVERVNVAALGGPDRINVADLSATDIKHVAIDLAAALGSTAGDGEIDSVTTSGTGNADHINVDERSERCHRRALGGGDY